jgi:DNA helicase-2/ATP-dependent DNA helicase PcrA
MLQSVPYQVIGGFSFYDRTEVKDCISMLRFAVNRQDGMALSRFINKPTCRVGETTIGKIENFARHNSCDLILALSKAKEIITTGADKLQIYKRCEAIVDAYSVDFSKMSIGEVLVHLVKELDYRKYLESKFQDKELEDKLSNMQELIDSCALYSDKRGNDIGAYLNNIALQSSSDKETIDNSVSLMSMHASKGLEFPVVFMPGLEEGQLPHSRAIKERDGLDEERRLCYVGMTRAKKRLIVTYPDARMQKYKNGAVNFAKTKPSRFLQESGLQKSMQIIRAK